MGAGRRGERGGSSKGARGERGGGGRAGGRGRSEEGTGHQRVPE